MKNDRYNEFAVKTEALVKPEDITAISFLGDFNRILPKKIQDSIMEKGSRSIPYMGFIVDPYCFFLAYGVKDREAAQALLPPGYDLADAAVFEGQKPQPLAIFSTFTARTSAFAGFRLEVYLIARNRETGLMSWIICDYDTNTNSHDPKNGFTGYSCDPALFTTTPQGELLVQVQSRKRDRKFELTAPLQGHDFRKLDQALWVEGNLSVDYGGEVKDPTSKSFGLIFDPALMEQALEVPLDQVKIQANSYFSEIIDGEKPLCAALFPYSQHFVIRQDMARQELLSEKDLRKEVDLFLSRSGYKTMKGDDLKKPILRSMMISTLVMWSLLAVLLVLALR